MGQTLADRTHARTGGFRRALERARAVIGEACRHGAFGVSVSGGKDSTVLLHLAATIDPTIRAAFFDSGCELTSTYAFLSTLDQVETIRPVRTLPEMCRHGGWWGYRYPVEYGARFDVLETLIYEPATRFARARQLTGYLLGLRGEESRGRWQLLRSRGPLFYSQADDRWICCPLASWTTADVWAYLAAFDVPSNPAYDAMTAAGIPRQQQRIAPALGGKAVSFGRVATIKRIDPGLYNRLAADFPLWAAEA